MFFVGGVIFGFFKLFHFGKKFVGYIIRNAGPNINNFVASINTDEFKILCGHIAYDGYTLKSFEECLFSKEKYYKDEREVRFYFMPNDDRNYSHKGMDIPIDPKTLIEEIVLSPYIKRSAAEKIAEVIRTEYGINNIHPSKIEIKK